MNMHHQLAMNLPLGQAETPTSFASRLAALHGCPSLRDFCHDMNFDVYDLAHGKPEGLSRLERLGDLPEGALSPYALVRTRDDFFLNGQTLRKASLRRERIHVCPACLQEDAAQHGGPPALRMFARAAWSLASVRSCSRHGIALVCLEGTRAGVRAYDFARAIVETAPDLDQLVETAPALPETPLERYLLERLWAKDREPTASADDLPWYAAARISEMLGAVALFGPRFRAEAMSASEWSKAGGAGYEILIGGAATFVDLIDDLRRASTAHDWGLRATYGRFYEWLAHEDDDPVYDRFRTIFRERCIETMPLGPGDVIFGEPVAVRRIHSIRSAWRETGCHPKRLRKLLWKLGVINDDDLALTDDRIVFPAELAADWLGEAASSMSLKAAGEYLNAPRVQIRMLFEQGFIEPFVEGGNETVHTHAFSRAELDTFLSRLLDGAEPVAVLSSDQANLPDAGRHACCSAAEIVKLILDGRLRWVGKLEGETGYLSAIVNVDEVRSCVRLDDHGGISLRQVEKRLLTGTNAVKALLRDGHLPAREAINPTNRCPQTIVMPGDLADFQSTFVSLSQLAKDRGVASRGLMRILREAGVGFAFDPDILEGHFYRRADLPT